MESIKVTAGPGNPSQLLHILQISDSVFPTGGFSHSSGFEAAEKHGLMGSQGKLKMFSVSVLENAGREYLPFVIHAHKNGLDLAEVLIADKMCQACLTNHVANRASVKQGRSMLDTAVKVYRAEPLALLQQRQHQGSFNAHFPVVFGVICSTLGIDLESALTMFMFETMRNIFASAVRLGHTGPIEAQRIQYEIQSVIPDIINRNCDLTIDDAGVCFPLVEILQNTHDTMFTKLFHS